MADIALVLLLIFTLLMPLLLFLVYYLTNKKFQARLRRRALVRMLDDSGEELGEFVAEYTPGKGMISIGKLAFPVEDRAIIRSRGTTIITVNATNGKMLNLREIGQTDAPINPYQLESLLISIYAASRAGVVELVESIRGRIDINLAISAINLILCVAIILHLGDVGAHVGAIEQQLNHTAIMNTSLKVV